MEFQTHLRYKFLAVLSLVMVLLFTWTLYQSFAGGSLFFLLACLGTGLWYLWVGFSRVRLSATGVELNLPLGAPREVAFRQLVSVSESGRIGRSITLIYHPLLDDGFLDLEQVQSLALPEVLKQQTLLENLEERIPQ